MLPCKWHAHRQPSTSARTIGVAVLLFGASTGVLTAQAGSPLRPADGWSEFFRTVEEIPVSGSLRVGVMTELTDEPVNPTVFHALLPGNHAPRLCVEISSRDGRYEMKRLSYDVAGQPGGTRAFTLPTRHARDLSRYPSEQLAILARLSPDCGDATGTFVVASWSQIVRPSTVSVYVNSNVPTFVGFASGDGAAADAAQCVELEGASRAFNRRCDFPMGWVQRGSLELRKRERRGSRNVFARTLLPITIPLMER